MNVLEILWNVVLYTVPFLGMIVILVTLHEWGHYYAARTLGIQVTHFSIGMGPVLWSRTDKNGCTWQISALPIGGYVRFLGDRDGSSASPSKQDLEAASTLTEAERRLRFQFRNPLDRAFVIAAGPVLNILLGLALIATLYVFHGRPVEPPIVGEVFASSPAAAAGIQAGDVITSINGHQITRFSEIFEDIGMFPGGAFEIELARPQDGGEPANHTIHVVAGTAKVKSFGISQTVGHIGIASTGQVRIEPIGPIEALWVGTGDVVQLTRGMLIGLGQIVTGVRPLSDVGGPVKMAEMSGAAVQISLSAFIFLVAAISINLGVMNLFPLPVLDGGQLLICAVETAMRRRVSGRILYMVHTAGAIFLICVMGLVTASDVIGLVSRLGA